MIFRDRTDAGRRLATELVRFRDRDPVVLALVRGGVPVAYEVALALAAPLDIVLVRKIGAPFQPELALGAVVDGETPETVTNDALIREIGIEPSYIAEAAKRELAEIERRRVLYLKGRRRPALAGTTAIVVDDGIATGATTRAALHAARRKEPARLVLAVPVAPPETIAELAPEADEIVCLAQPPLFGAIGAFYDDFRQVSDRAVIDLLDRASAAVPRTGGEPGKDEHRDQDHPGADRRIRSRP
jgi:putative phosphoribosyl transferase